MEPVGKIVKDVMQSLQALEDLKTDVIKQKSQISIENQNLAIIDKEVQLFEERLSNIQATSQSLQDQEQFLKNTRESYIKAQLWRLYFNKFVSDMDPNEEHTATMLSEYHNRYLTLVKKYELRPEYQQITDAENTRRQLEQMISEKRNELMRLETEREYLVD